MDKKPTDSEIKSALKGAILNAKSLDCKVWSVEVNKLENALDLINRLQEDLDNLIQNDLPRCKDALRRANEMGMELQAENERLKESLNIELENYATEYDNKIKAEAYKECIEEVKKELSLIRLGCRKLLDNEGVFAIDLARKQVDNLLKELVGE